MLFISRLEMLARMRVREHITLPEGKNLLLLHDAVDGVMMVMTVMNGVKNMMVQKIVAQTFFI